MIFSLGYVVKIPQGNHIHSDMPPCSRIRYASSNLGRKFSISQMD